MAYIVMAYIVMAYIAMADMVMARTVMAHVDMAVRHARQCFAEQVAVSALYRLDLP